MMKAIIFLLFIIQSFQVLSQVYFNDRLEFNYPWVFDGAGNCLEVEDGYIINGVTGDSLDPYWHQIAIAKIDFWGNEVWKKNWGDTISRWYYADRNSLQKINNSFFSFGTNTTYYESGSLVEIIMIKYNSNLDTLWTKRISEIIQPYDTAYIARSFVISDGGFIVAGTKSYQGVHSEAMLLAFDTTGNVVWEHVYGTNELYYTANSVVRLENDSFVFGGKAYRIGNYGAVIGDPVVIKTDSLGNKEWEVNLGGTYSDGPALLCNSVDGNIIACSRFALDSLDYNKYPSKIQLSKIDKNGNILWNYLYCDKALSTGPTNIRSDSSSGYIISGAAGDNHWSEPEKMGFMLRIDSAGNELWYRKYGVLWDEDSRNYLYDAIPTDNNGFLGVGGCKPFGSDTGTQDAWIIKVDSLGCTSHTDCWVGQEEEVWVTTEKGNQIIIFPNPAQNWFEVEIDKNKEPARSFTVEVFDLFGRLTEEVEIPKGQNMIRLYVGDWKKGMYLLRVKNRNGVLGSGKVVIK